jgi:DNA-binding response OmpR family regulator
MLPGMDGFAVARSQRRSKISTPVIMLTARDATSDIVLGWIVESTTISRNHSPSRRTSTSASLSYRMADLELDPLTHAASRSGVSITLTRTEFLLLEFMMRNPRVVLRRDTIINAV